MKIVKSLMFFMVLAVAFFACQGPMDEITKTEYPQAFSPIDLEVTQGAFGSVTVRWRTVDGAKAYIVELSKDVLEFKNFVGVWEVEATSLLITNLVGETDYSVRVKSISTDYEYQIDSKWNEIAFRTNPEQLFNNLRDEDVRTGQIRLRWTPDPDVTKLNVEPDIGDITLTDEEIEKGEKALTGLTPVTQYVITIWNGDLKRGTLEATTKWRPSGEGVVELAIGDDLAAAMNDPANGGKIIFLPEGYTYTWASSIRPEANIKIFGDPDGDRPFFTIPHNTPITVDGLTADSVCFEYVTFHSVHGDGYFINQGNNNTTAVCNIGMLKFENCRFIDFGRSIVRAQNENQRFELIHFNRCLIENSNSNAGQNYAFIQCTFAFEALPDIRVTNTTVNHAYVSFINIAGGTGQPSGKNVLIENVTFYKTVGFNGTSESDRFLIDGGTNGPVNLTVRNCILGSVKGVGRERGYRFAEGSTMTASGNYATTDWTTVAEGAMLNIPATPYAGTAAALFVDPDNGDFSIKDENFPGIGVAGDPRWW